MPKTKKKQKQLVKTPNRPMPTDPKELVRAMFQVGDYYTFGSKRVLDPSTKELPKGK